MPSGPSTAARTPFVLLVVVLLGGGLITLLLLNTSLNEGSFRLSELRKKTTELTDQEQALQRDVDERSAPDALERRARELGMVPGGNPAFLGPDGTVRGVPKRAKADPSAVRRPDPSQRPVGPPVAPPPPASGAPAPVPASPKPSAAGASAVPAAPSASAQPAASGAPKPPPTTPGR
ncbi:septum formation initiator family protein [Streptomyces sp. HNM0645]|uniref:FtsB family cell division protein n=1 Tax=Streptomyces sp. HNM0645 TaxID=2782343 RepID=UPI0024B82E26|nr:septum formation initiator family protein [Streptomyces sp. HNM0645]MDI9888066.1 septum formation initiator family protein [Streptomyces sp. HNM0645]